MSLRSGDLTTLATLQAYAPSTINAAILPGMIARASRWILNELNRSFILPKTYNEFYSGTGTRQLILPNWPVLGIASLYVDGALQREVSSLTVNGVTVYSSVYGWSFAAWDGIPPGSPAAVALAGGQSFWSGIRNIQIAYTAGYQVTDEEATIPALGPPADPDADPPILATEYTVEPIQPYGTWATDQGVTYADGTPLVAITSGTPNVGEYLPPAPDAATPRLDYTFSEDDAEAAVLLSYGYIPADLEQLALELILSRNEYRRNAGIRSKTLANQETIVFDNRPLSQSAAGIISAYRSVLPPNMGIFV